MSCSPPRGHDHVHQLVQDENAKTILLNVPLEVAVGGEIKSFKKPSSSSSLASPKDGHNREPPNPRRKVSASTSTSSLECKPRRVRSASAGRDRKSELHARYWACLFENLRRAVDDLYNTCEADDSAPAAKEVVLVLENYVRDFKNLVAWFKLKFEYETTPPPQRPTSLAWEVRKTSPAAGLVRPSSSQVSLRAAALEQQRLLMASPAKRALNFDGMEGKKKVEPLQTQHEEQEITPTEEKENEEPKNKKELEIAIPKKGIDAKAAEQKKETQLETVKEHVKPNAKTNARITAKTASSVVSKPKAGSAKATSVSNRVRPTGNASISGSVKSQGSNRPLSGSRSGSTTSTRTSSAAAMTRNAGNKHSTSSPDLGRATSAVQSKQSESDSTKSDTKPQRLSLVARQSMVAGPSVSNRAPLARSATTANISRTKTTRAPLASKPLSATLTRTTSVPLKASSSVTTSKTSLPFGSSSSISSAGSSRSWADTVKGLKAPRSVENVASKNEDDDAGWETVRSRARSRFSPNSDRFPAKTVSKSSQVLNRAALSRKDKTEAKSKVSHSHKTRYVLPSSAMSLPALALMKEEEAISEKSSESASSREKRPIKTESSIKKAARLNKLAEVRSQGSSSESLSEKSLKKTGTLVATAAKKAAASRSKVAPTRTVAKPATARSTSSTQRNTDKVRSNASKEAVKPEPEAKEELVKSENADDTTDSAIALKEVAIARAQEEEEKLHREIIETEKQELSETDAGEDSDLQSITSDKETATTPTRFDVKVETLSWADEIELEEQIYESRYPGRAIQLHEKLSSPARKKEPQEAFREHQEKQKQARLRREKFQDRKASKLNALNLKIEEVIAQKEQLINERKQLLLGKMRKAEEKRQQHIDNIRRKAHVEEAKLKEIAFINELQAQNSRIDMLTHNQNVDEKTEERLAELAEERARKVGEREAKEARAEERRRQLEEKRLKSMQALKERIRTREERIQEEQEQQRKDREEAAREKARDREEKLSSVREAEQDMKNELQEKIQQKQEDAAKRHKEKLERVRNKAFELSVQRCSTDEGVPLLQAYEKKKKCDICDVLISNEVHLQSHLRGKKHSERVSQKNEGRKLSREEIQSCNLKYIIDAAENELDPKTVQAKERSKAMKKRVKKIKTRMATRAAEYETKVVVPSKFDGPNRAKIGKSLKDIEKIFSSQGKGAWPNNTLASLERSMGEINRALDKNNKQDKVCFFALGGFSTLAKIFHAMFDQKVACVIPLKSVVTCSKTWLLACKGDKANTEYVLKNNHVTTIVDVLLDRLNVLLPTEDLELLQECPPSDGPQVDPVAKALMGLLAGTLEDIAVLLKKDSKPIDQSRPQDLNVRVQDQLSYMVSIGIIDKLASYLNGIQDPIDNKPEVGEFLLACLKFMSAFASVAEVLVKPSLDPNTPPSDPTYMLTAYQVTDLAGLVSLLYGILLHQGAPTRGEEEPPGLPSHTIAVATAASQLLFHLVRQHLTMVQEVLGQEGISLEFRHIASYLLWFCQHHKERELLHLTIILVGYFAARHADNQVIVQSGQQPSVLQQLCSLPFPYFSQPDLKKILFPTLIAACQDNKENLGILAEEMSYKLLEDFIDSQDGKETHLVKLVVSK